MVYKFPQTRLVDLRINGSVLLRDGKEIAEFPTPVCQAARLNDDIFVILHPYPIDSHMDYAGTNLWSLNMNGDLNWKAPNLNGDCRAREPNFYAELYFFDVADPKIFTITADERISAIFDVSTGRKIPRAEVKAEPIRDRIFAQATAYLMALAHDPPERSGIQSLESNNGGSDLHCD